VTRYRRFVNYSAAKDHKLIIKMMPVDIAAFPKLELTNVGRGL